LSPLTNQFDLRAWCVHGACRQHPTEWWFAFGRTETARARQICQACPVRTECLSYALERRSLLGIWAGTTPVERALIRFRGEARPAGPPNRLRTRRSVVRLVLLGAPGSGKGTQGEILARRFGVPHISSGDLLRAHVASRSRLGRQVKAHLDRGDLVPDDLILAMVADATAEGGAHRGYVLDGFPRTLAQAKRAFALARSDDVFADAVVYLALSDDVARRRLAQRAGGGRSDDANQTVIERRLHLFHKSTKLLLGFYRGHGMLVEVDAARSIGAVSRSIFGGINALTSAS
jgi:adenylate kinase